MCANIEWPSRLHLSIDVTASHTNVSYVEGGDPEAHTCIGQWRESDFNSIFGVISLKWHQECGHHHLNRPIWISEVGNFIAALINRITKCRYADSIAFFFTSSTKQCRVLCSIYSFTYDYDAFYFETLWICDFNFIFHSEIHNAFYFHVIQVIHINILCPT